jgi:hypothetical protein
MNPQFLGDSYDIVKQSFLRWLDATGRWATHPMLTAPLSSEQAHHYGRLVGTPILSCEVLNIGVDRDAYLAPARDWPDHVFLDPDTGIRLQPVGGKRAPKYLFGPELVAIAKERPGRLTLVFDQSVARGAERQQLQDKLSNLAACGVHGVAYVSHACFVLVGMDHSAVAAALESLKRESGLPGCRFLAGAL